MNTSRGRSVFQSMPFRQRLCVCSVLFAACSGVIVARAQQSTAPSPVIVQPGAPGEPSRTLPAGAHAPHHGQAVEMTALIPTHTTDPQVSAIGARISRSQTDEMQFMKRWLRARGEKAGMTMPEAMPGMPEMTMTGAPMPTMPGMLTSTQMEALRKAHGTDFDRLFLTGMIQHHNGALIMVRDLFNSAGAGQDADLFDFATDADNTQRAEIRIMEGMLHKEDAPAASTR